MTTLYFIIPVIKNNFAEADGGNPHASSCLSMQPCKSHPVYNGSVNDLFSLHCRVESYLMINTYKFKSVYNHLQLSEDLHTSRSPPPLFPLQGVKTPNMNEAGGKSALLLLEDYLFLFAGFVGTEIFLLRLPAEQLPAERGRDVCLVVLV